MPNMAVAYRGPDPSLIQLTNELRAHYGNPARTYEFVTGYKSAGNYSGHNPDANGIVHAVDIFADDNGNIPEAEGRALAERLRLIGKRTGRFSYLIHDMSAGAPQPMIAGSHTSWLWVPYTGADAHSDHIHLSIADGYWGDPCNVASSIYNDTSSWGIATTAPLANDITPISEDWFDMATKEEVKQAIRDVLAENLSGTKAAKTAGTLGWAIMNGRDHSQLANNGAKANGKALASVAAQTAAIKALAAAKPGLDPEAVQASIDKAVQAALKDLSVTLSVEADK